MNAQDKVIEYARKHNRFTHLTDEQFVGAMHLEGICIEQRGGENVIANLRREGREIIITETTTTPTIDGEKSETVEVLRVEI